MIVVQQLFQSRVIPIPARVVGKPVQHAELIVVHQITQPDSELLLSGFTYNALKYCDQLTLVCNYPFIRILHFDNSGSGHLRHEEQSSLLGLKTNS